MEESQILALIKMVPLAFAALFPVINPLGTALILLSMTGESGLKLQNEMALTVSRNSLLLLTFILFAGHYVLAFFGLTIPIVQVAGGIVLSSMGWSMLKDTPKEEKSTVKNGPTNLSDKYLYPFTFPMVVGPGGIAVSLTLSAHSQHGGISRRLTHQIGVLLGMLGICVLLYFSLRYSTVIAKKLGESGTKALQRIMAFVLLCIGVEIFWSGAAVLLKI